MRYRRLSSRYLVVQAGLPPFTAAWRVERLAVTLAEPRWRPETDIYETPDAIAVVVALAGIDPDAVEVSLFEDAVVIEGRRRLACEEGGLYRAAEIPQGPFRVEVELTSPVDPDAVDARYEQGLLRLTLPKPGPR